MNENEFEKVMERALWQFNHHKKGVSEALAGDVRAQWSLGLHYKNDSYFKDEFEALKWLIIALANGSQEAEASINDFLTKQNQKFLVSHEFNVSLILEAANRARDVYKDEQRLRIAIEKVMNKYGRLATNTDVSSFLRSIF